MIILTSRFRAHAERGWKQRNTERPSGGALIIQQRYDRGCDLLGTVEGVTGGGIQDLPARWSHHEPPRSPAANHRSLERSGVGALLQAPCPQGQPCKSGPWEMGGSRFASFPGGVCNTGATPEVESTPPGAPPLSLTAWAPILVPQGITLDGTTVGFPLALPRADLPVTWASNSVGYRGSGQNWK